MTTTKNISHLSLNEFNYILTYVPISDLYLNCSLVCSEWFHHLRHFESGFFRHVYFPILKHRHEHSTRAHLPFNVHSALSWVRFIPPKPYVDEHYVYQYLYDHLNVKEVDADYIQINLPIAPEIDDGGLPKVNFFGVTQNREQLFVPVLMKRSGDDQSATLHVFVDVTGSTSTILRLDYEQCLNIELNQNEMQLQTIRFLAKTPGSSNPSIHGREMFKSLLTTLGLSETDESIPLATFLLNIRDSYTVNATRDEYKSPKSAILSYDHLYIDDRSPFWFLMTRKLVKLHDRLVSVPQSIQKEQSAKIFNSIHAIVHTHQYEEEIPRVLYYVARYSTVEQFSDFLQLLQLKYMTQSGIVNLFNRYSVAEESPLVGLLQGYDKLPSQKFDMLLVVLDETEIKSLITEHDFLYYTIQAAKEAPESVLPEYRNIIDKLVFEYLRWQEFPSGWHSDSLSNDKLVRVFSNILHLITHLPEDLIRLHKDVIHELVNYSDSGNHLTPLQRAVLNFPDKVSDLLKLGAEPDKKTTFEYKSDCLEDHEKLKFSALDEALLYPDNQQLFSSLKQHIQSRHFENIFDQQSKFESITMRENTPLKIVLIGRPKSGKRSIVDRILQRDIQSLNSEDQMFNRTSLSDQTKFVRYRKSSGLFNTKPYRETITYSCDGVDIPLEITTIQAFEIDAIIESQPVKTILTDELLLAAQRDLSEANIVLACYNLNDELSISTLQQLELLKTLIQKDTTVGIVGTGAGDSIERRILRLTAKKFAHESQSLLFELKSALDDASLRTLLETCLRHYFQYMNEKRTVSGSLVHAPRRSRFSLDLSLLSYNILYPINSTESVDLNQAISSIGTNDLQTVCDRLIPYLSDVTQLAQLLEHVPTDQKVSPVFNAWNKLQHIVNSLEAHPTRLHLKLEKYATTIVNYLSSEVLLGYVDKYLRISLWKELLFTCQILSFGYKSELLQAIHSVLSSLAFSQQPIGFIIDMIDGLLSIIGNVFYDEISNSDSSVSELVSVLKMNWISMMEQSQNIQHVNQAVIDYMYRRINTEMTNELDETATRTVLFMLQNGMLHEVSFMEQFYNALFERVVSDTCTSAEQEFVQKVVTILQSRIAMKCLYLVKEHNSKSIQKTKLHNDANSIISFDHNVLLLVNGVTYNTDELKQKHINPVDVQIQLTSPYEQLFSQQYFTQEMEFARTKVTSSQYFVPRINWLYEYGTADLKFNTNFATKTITVSTIQMSALLLYNDPQIHENGITLTEMLNKLVSQYASNEVKQQWKSQIIPLIRNKVLIFEGTKFQQDQSILKITRENWKENNVKISIPRI
jgi:hypothetical protein